MKTDTRKPRSRVSALASPRRSRRRAASSSTPLTARGGVVLVFVVSVVGSLLGSGTGISWVPGAAFAFACLVAVLGVRRRDLLGLTVSPPVTYFVVAVLMALWGPAAAPGSGGSAGGVAIRLITDLVAATPWLFLGTLLVLGIATVRGLPANVRELNALLAAERQAAGSGGSGTSGGSGSSGGSGDDAHGSGGSTATGAGGDDGPGPRPAGEDDGDRGDAGFDADGDPDAELGAGVTIGESVGVRVSVADSVGDSASTGGDDHAADDDRGVGGDRGDGDDRDGERGGERGGGAAPEAKPRSHRRKTTLTRSARRALHRRRRRSLPTEDPVRWDEEPPL